MNMKCQEVSQMISRLADGELSPAERDVLKQHLASCPACRQESEAMKRLDSALRDIPPAPIPEGMAERLLQAVAERTTPRRSRNRVTFSPAFALAATLVFALIVVYLAAQLRQARREAVFLARKMAHASHAAGPARETPCDALSTPTERAVMEQLQVFRASHEYLNGQLRWMVTDGDEIQTGMSSHPIALANASETETIVLNLQYIECAEDEKPRVLSNPEFLFFSGDEVSVRLRGRSSGHPVLRYRVRGERLIDGRIRAEIGFAQDSPLPDGVKSAINTQVQLVPGKPVLLGAGGDDSRRWELYAWGLSRPIGYRPDTKELNPL